MFYFDINAGNIWNMEMQISGYSSLGEYEFYSSVLNVALSNDNTQQQERWFLW